MSSSKQIYAISDIHLEFYDESIFHKLDLPNADILLLCGDIGQPFEGNDKVYTEFLKQCKEKFPEVVVGCGNHEFYQGHPIPSTTQALRDICSPLGIHFLQRESVLLFDSIMIHGATLWSLIDEGIPINDFPKVFPDRLDYVEAFFQDYSFLRQSLAVKDPALKHIVMTHHCPTRQVLHPRFRKYGSLNTGFATEILSKLNCDGVQYWFCGHTHEYGTTKHGDMTVVVNPVGYPDEMRQTKVSKAVYAI